MMSAPLLIVISSFLFATMGVCVKLAAPYYNLGELVMYRGVIGAIFIVFTAKWQGIDLRTEVPVMHLWRVLVGAGSLALWFLSLSNLPVATAMTLNYLSAVWMALFMIGGAVMMNLQSTDADSSRSSGVDPRLVATVLIGFAGVACALRPTIERDQLWYGLTGLGSGILSAMALMQVTALGRAGEPEVRIVFYFSIGSAVVGALIALVGSGFHAHTLAGATWLIAIGVLATVAQLTITRAYNIGKVLVNASLSYLGIAFAFGYGVLLFDDPITWMALLGMALIVVAGIYATLLRQTAAPAAAAHSTLES